MIIYLDLIIFLNFVFDSLLLVVVNVTLRRNAKLWRILLGGLVGSLSIFLLFIRINSLELFLLKIIVSILMLLVTFGYRNIKYFLHNAFYLYLASMILGGFLYFLNIQLNINLAFLLIFSPVILYIYIRSNKKLRNNYNEYYQIKIVFSNNRSLELTAFLDTGNKLVDPYFFKPIILIDRKSLEKKVSIKNPILVPFNSLNNKSLLKCIKIKSLIIDNKKTNNVLVGISNEKFNIDGINCILNPKVLEELK